MDLLKAYDKDSRKHVVGSIQGGKSLSPVYRLLSPVYGPLSTDKGIALVMVLFGGHGTPPFG